MGIDAASLEQAARLALVVSRDDWAMVALDLPGAAPLRWCTADDPALTALFDALEACGAGQAQDACELPDLETARLPAACRAALLSCGARSYRAVRRSLAPGQGSCVVAVASAAVRAADPAVLQALGLVADLLAGPAGDCAAARRGHAEQAQQQFRLLFESAPGLYLVLTPDDYTIVAASNAYLDATMLTRAETIGRRLFELFPDDPDDDSGGVAALDASLRRVRQSGAADVMAVQRYPIRRPAAQGGAFEVRYWSPINSPVLDAGGKVAYIIHRVEDVTDYVLSHRPAGADPLLQKATRLEAEIVQRSHELRRMADSLAQSEQRLRMQAEMLDYATDAIVVCDLDNRMLYWNRAAAARYGWRSEDVLGRPVTETLYAGTDDADFQHAMRILMRQGDYAGRMTHAAADGRRFVVHVHWILVRREDGSARAILSVVTDLSEQIALEQRLLRIQKLESLGRLTGVLAHDFNNWLTVIIGSAEELVDGLDGQDALREAARMIQLAGERGAALTRRLLAFGRRQALAPRILDAGATIDALRPLIAGSLPENVDLQLLDTGNRWCVHADQAQLEAAVVNLCINARDAMPNGGKLTIQLLLVEMEARKPALHRALAPGEYVAIAVADTGHGIPREVLEHVFEPFFTTKDEGAGSGLGLSMVYGFATQSNGDVTIYSEPGRGTQVKLYLPRAHAAPPPQAAAPVAAARPPSGCAVLLVEDDADVRAHIAARLRELGCKVAETARAADALARLEGGDAFDLLFTDVVMPDMSGIELARRARAMRPGLRILLSSGYTFEAMRHRDALGPDVCFLNKPYGKAVLAQALADALAAPGRTP